MLEQFRNKLALDNDTWSRYFYIGLSILFINDLTEIQQVLNVIYGR